VSFYVAVYRRAIPSRAEWEATLHAGQTNLELGRFLGSYLDANSYFDWGDDPSFFSAIAAFGDARLASWGVCRPDVREDLRIGDVVAFFVAKTEFALHRTVPEATGPATYYFI
jgi:hypothetical protein